MSLEPGTLVGRYAIVRKLAEGGMAEIFLATVQGVEGFQKDVVIKRVRPVFANDASFTEMFVEEARVVSRLSHPNIVQIFDFDRHGDTYFLAMEYVRGRSLSEAYKRARELSVPVSPVLAARIVQDVARGLAYAHRLSDGREVLQLVHRDVTPHNVLVSYDGAVKLTDFGIAKASNRATTAGMLKGKFAYMSPEQARGEPLDPRTDIFALGIVLWELLTAGRLFDADSDLAVLRAVQEREVLPPSVLNPAVDGDLDAIVLQALARDPAHRYATAGELERALATFVMRRSASPEDSDVGAWMRELFPIEAKRAEPSVARSTPRASPGRAAAEPSPAFAAAAGPAGTAGQSRTSLSAGPVVPWLPPGEDARAATVVSGNRVAPDAVEVTRTPVTQAPVVRPPVAPGTGGLAAVVAQVRAWVDANRPIALAGGGLVAVLLVGGLVLALRHGPGPDASRASGTASAKDEETPIVLTPKITVTPPPPDRPSPPVPVSTEPGTLVLTVRPWGNVFIDGQPVKREQVGPRKYVLAPGTHVVTVRGPKSEETSVDIRAGEQTALTVRLK